MNNADPLAYGWDFDDGTFGPNTATVMKTLTGNRVFNVRCTVSDMKGLKVTRGVLVTVGSPANYTLTGTINAGGAPLEGVLVSDGTRRTFTTSSGTYALTDVPAGSYTLSASLFDYAFTRGFADPLTVSAAATGLDFTAVPGGPYAVSGKVTSIGSGVAGVTVSDGTRTATTDSSGNYVLTGVPNGRYNMQAVKAGWDFYNPSASSLEVFGSSRTGIDFYPLGTTLGGRIPADQVPTAPVITDGVRTVTATLATGGSGEPMRDAGSADAGLEWVYYLGSVPAGKWNLIATSPGVTLTPSGFANPVTVPAIGSYVGDLNFQVSTGTTYNVSGQVLTGTTPVPGVTITAGAKTAMTDSLGQYTLVGLAPGMHSVSAARAGYTFMPASQTIAITASSLTGINFTSTVVNAPPTIAAAASASPAVTTSTSSVLSVLGADDNGEANLIYTWESLNYTVTFMTTQGTNAAKTSTVVFQGASVHQFRVTITDAGGLSVTSTVNVNVQQVAVGAVMTPASANIGTLQNGYVTASLIDQFGKNIYTSNWVWNFPGPGTISIFGGFSGTIHAPGTPGGPYSFSATSGTFTANGSFTVVVPAVPIIVTAAAATPNPTATTTTTLSVTASDDQGEPALTYTWSTVGSPPAAVVFTPNGTNAAKNATATFTQGGSYTLRVTVTDAQSQSATSQVVVNVTATPTRVVVTPSSANVVVGATRTFGASVNNQFGVAVAPQPAVTWSVNGDGTINGAGLFTAGPTPGAFTVTATSGSLTGTAAVTVSAAPDTTPPTVTVISPTAAAEHTGAF